MSDDELYLALKGARERLCRVESGHGLTVDDGYLLDAAISLIDQVATRRCPQWSRHDRADAESCALEFGNQWPDGHTMLRKSLAAARAHVAASRVRGTGTVVERQVWRGPWREVPDEAR
jgi:hypothetical protein